MKPQDSTHRCINPCLLFAKALCRHGNLSLLSRHKLCGARPIKVICGACQIKVFRGACRNVLLICMLPRDTLSSFMT